MEDLSVNVNRERTLTFTDSDKEYEEDHSVDCIKLAPTQGIRALETRFISHVRSASHHINMWLQTHVEQ